MTDLTPAEHYERAVALEEGAAASTTRDPERATALATRALVHATLARGETPVTDQAAVGFIELRAEVADAISGWDGDAPTIDIAAAVALALWRRGYRATWPAEAAPQADDVHSHSAGWVSR